MAASLAEVASAWHDSGGHAMDMFVLQHLDQIFGDVAKAATRIKVGEVNLIDGGAGKTIPAYAAAYPATMAALFEHVTRTLGVDIARVITGTSATAPTPGRGRSRPGFVGETSRWLVVRYLSESRTLRTTRPVVGRATP
jgi:flotillin